MEELFGESESESEFEGFSSASNSSSEESSNFISIVKPKISSVRLGIMLFLLGMLGIFIEARSEPNIGKIYDCSITQKLGVFSPPSETSCLKDLHARKTEIFSAEVRQYKPKITNFPIYLCEIHYVVKECSENFIGQDHTERIDTFLPVTLDQCFAAMNRRISPYGMLKKVEGENRWITQNERQYKCSWMRKRKVHYYRFVLTESSAMLSGRDRIIHQSITSTNCYSYESYCRPQEENNGLIVWGKINHDFELYHSIGIFKINKIGDFYLVGSLGIGGSEIQSFEDLILLDNSYVIRKITTGRKNKSTKENSNISSNATKEFNRFSEDYAENTKANVQRELLEGRLAKELLNENHLISTLSSSFCTLQKEIFGIQKLIMHSFLEVAHELMSNREGEFVESVGDALLIRKCDLVIIREIYWNQTWNGTCFQLLPVITTVGEIKYLELSTRKIFNSSMSISCHNRPDHTFVKDVKGIFRKYRLNKGFQKIKLRYESYSARPFSLPKLATYNSLLKHYEVAKPHRTTLLEMLALQRDNINELTNLRKKGGDS